MYISQTNLVEKGGRHVAPLKSTPEYNQYRNGFKLLNYIPKSLFVPMSYSITPA